MKYFIFLFAAFTHLSVYPQAQKPSVHIVGAMKNVMWKGQLQGSIDLDTISDKKNLYGIGPVEGLTGELLIIDGKAYKSTVVSSDEMKVEETYNARAPFFVYGYAARFVESTLPASVHNLEDLEAYIDQKTESNKNPFLFVLKGQVKKASVHIVNLPAGSTVNSPPDAHIGQANYNIENTFVEIVGFFSRNHQSVFTHHDTFMHLHLITKDGTKMGHLDSIVFNPGQIRLYLAE